MLYSSGGRPATAFSPMLGISVSWYTHTSVPSALHDASRRDSFHFAGRCASKSVGGSTTWSSTLTRMRSSALGMAALRSRSRYWLPFSLGPFLVASRPDRWGPRDDLNVTDFSLVLARVWLGVMIFAHGWRHVARGSARVRGWPTGSRASGRARLAARLDGHADRARGRRRARRRLPHALRVRRARLDRARRRGHEPSQERLLPHARRRGGSTSSASGSLSIALGTLGPGTWSLDHAIGFSFPFQNGTALLITAVRRDRRHCGVPRGVLAPAEGADLGHASCRPASGGQRPTTSRQSATIPMSAAARTGAAGAGWTARIVPAPATPTRGSNAPRDPERDVEPRGQARPVSPTWRPGGSQRRSATGRVQASAAPSSPRSGTRRGYSAGSHPEPDADHDRGPVQLGEPRVVGARADVDPRARGDGVGARRDARRASRLRPGHGTRSHGHRPRGAPATVVVSEQLAGEHRRLDARRAPPSADRSRRRRAPRRARPRCAPRPRGPVGAGHQHDDPARPWRPSGRRRSRRPPPPPIHPVAAPGPRPTPRARAAPRPGRWPRRGRRPRGAGPPRPGGRRPVDSAGLDEDADRVAARGPRVAGRPVGHPYGLQGAARRELLDGPRRSADGPSKTVGPVAVAGGPRPDRGGRAGSPDAVEGDGARHRVEVRAQTGGGRRLDEPLGARHDGGQLDAGLGPAVVELAAHVERRALGGSGSGPGRRRAAEPAPATCAPMWPPSSSTPRRPVGRGRSRPPRAARR